MEAEISVAESTIFSLTMANVEFRRLKRSKWACNNLMRSCRKKKSKKQMSVIVEAKEKMEAVTDEKVLKRNLGWHLTGLIFWLPGPSFWFELVSIWPQVSSRVGAYCWRNQGFSTISSLPPNATAFEELSSLITDWDTRPQRWQQQLCISSTVSNALLGPKPYTY